jgi:predicted RNA binding protein YcfA (HicA-like mRNA interferase family)
MTKPMKKRQVIETMRSVGGSFVRQGAEHEVWECPCGQHKTAVPRHNQITAGVVASIQKQFACLPKGWLQ